MKHLVSWPVLLAVALTARAVVPAGSVAHAARVRFSHVALTAPVPTSADGAAEPAPSRPLATDGSSLPAHPLEDQEPTPPGTRLSSARLMLELLGIGPPHLQSLVDGRPFTADEQPTLEKFLYRIPRLGLDRLEAWCQREVSWTDVAQHPERYRVEVFPVAGRVTGLQRVPLAAQDASRFEYDHYFRVQLHLDGAPYPVLAYTREVPEAWQAQTQLDERASFCGLFLKTGGHEAGQPQLVFATLRIAWHPDRENTTLGVTADHVLLGELGMDVGLFEAVRRTNRKALGAEDRECFYQLLAATRRAVPAALYQQASKSFDVAALLQRPETQQGRLLRLTGTARRVQRIAVSEEDLRQRFGIDHYYQIDLFVPLGDVEVRFGAGPKANRGPIFANNYPVTCCVLDLPQDLPAEDNIAIPVVLAGFFVKLWAYQTEYVSSIDPQQRQLGPLFIGTAPRVVDSSRFGSSLWSWLGAAVVLLVLGYLVFGAWILPRRDRRFEQAMRRRGWGLAADNPAINLDIEPKVPPEVEGLDSQPNEDMAK